MDAVGEINVGPAGRPEHHGIARRGARKAVRRRILAIVCFGLDDDSADAVDEQRHPDQPAGDHQGILREIDAAAAARGHGRT